MLPLLNVVAAVSSVVLGLMKYFDSDSHETAKVVFRYVQLSSGVFLRVETVTVSYKNCDNVIIELFYEMPLVMYLVFV